MMRLKYIIFFKKSQPVLTFETIDSVNEPETNPKEKKL